MKLPTSIENILLLIMLIILGGILSNKKFVNLNVIFYGVIYIMLIILMETMLHCVAILFILEYNINVKLMTIFIFGILSISMILLSKNTIFRTIRVIKYYIHKKNLINGHYEIAIISDIKYLTLGRFDSRVNYLIVDYN